jgi:hypothetical protein
LAVARAEVEGGRASVSALITEVLEGQIDDLEAKYK